MDPSFIDSVVAKMTGDSRICILTFVCAPKIKQRDLQASMSHIVKIVQLTLLPLCWTKLSPMGPRIRPFFVFAASSLPLFPSYSYSIAWPDTDPGDLPEEMGRGYIVRRTITKEDFACLPPPSFSEMQ